MYRRLGKNSDFGENVTFFQVSVGDDAHGVPFTGPCQALITNYKL